MYTTIFTSSNPPPSYHYRPTEKVFEGAQFTILGVCNGDIIAPKPNVGTGKIEYIRTRDDYQPLKSVTHQYSIN